MASARSLNKYLIIMGRRIEILLDGKPLGVLSADMQINVDLQEYPSEILHLSVTAAVQPLGPQSS